MEYNKDVFEVEFKCINCGNVWTQRYPAECRVTDQWNGCKVLDNGMYDRIVCPVCESTVDVGIKARRPLEATLFKSEPELSPPKHVNCEVNIINERHNCFPECEHYGDTTTCRCKPTKINIKDVNKIPKWCPFNRLNYEIKY